MPRLKEIHANLLDRLREAKNQGWLGEVAAIEVSIAAADQKLDAMRQLAAKHKTVHLGMPDFRPSVGRSSQFPKVHRHLPPTNLDASRRDNVLPTRRSDRHSHDQRTDIPQTVYTDS